MLEEPDVLGCCHHFHVKCSPINCHKFWNNPKKINHEGCVPRQRRNFIISFFFFFDFSHYTCIRSVCHQLWLPLLKWILQFLSPEAHNDIMIEYFNHITFNSILIAAGKKSLHHLCHHNRLRVVTLQIADFQSKSVISQTLMLAKQQIWFRISH